MNFIVYSLFLLMPCPMVWRGHSHLSWYLVVTLSQDVMLMCHYMITTTNGLNFQLFHIMFRNTLHNHKYSRSSLFFLISQPSYYQSYTRYAPTYRVVEYPATTSSGVAYPHHSQRTEVIQAPPLYTLQV